MYRDIRHKKPVKKNQTPGSRHLQSDITNEYVAAGIQYPASSIQHPASSIRPFIIPIFLPHAGCPHRCVFCNQVSITGAEQATAEADHIRSRIIAFLNYKTPHRKPVQISFFGGNFLGLKINEIQYLLGLAAEFVQRGDVDSIRFSTRRTRDRPATPAARTPARPASGSRCASRAESCPSRRASRSASRHPGVRSPRPPRRSSPRRRAPRAAPPASPRPARSRGPSNHSPLGPFPRYGAKSVGTRRACVVRGVARVA